MKVLVINCGSSSLKYQLIDMTTEESLAQGLVERIGIEGSVLTQKVEGTGLGLFITKALVQKLKGSICAQNHENGNVFVLKLPASSVEKNLEYKLLGENNEW